MNTPPPCKPYPTDVSDEEWALVAPYLTLLPEDALQRRYPLREVFNAARRGAGLDSDVIVWLLVVAIYIKGLIHPVASGPLAGRWRRSGAISASRSFAFRFDLHA